MTYEVTFRHGEKIPEGKGGNQRRRKKKGVTFFLRGKGVKRRKGEEGVIYSPF